MSLNDSAYTSTPTIVRGAARFVTLTVSDFSSLTSLGVSGATNLSGTLTVGGQAVFTGTSATFENDVTLGATPGDTITFYGLEVHNAGATFDCDVNLGASSADTVTVAATVAQNGPLTFASGMDRTTNAAEPTATDLTLTWNGTPNLVSIIASVTGRTMTMSAAGPPPDNVRKTIKNSYESAYAFTVRDGATAATLAVLSPGQECTVFWEADDARWY